MFLRKKAFFFFLSFSSCTLTSSLAPCWSCVLHITALSSCIKFIPSTLIIIIYWFLIIQQKSCDFLRFRYFDIVSCVLCINAGCNTTFSVFPKDCREERHNSTGNHSLIMQYIPFYEDTTYCSFLRIWYKRKKWTHQELILVWNRFNSFIIHN